MHLGFPNHLLGLVLCPHDGGSLASSSGATYIRDEEVRCTSCDRRFDVRSGILELIASEMHKETAHEQKLRDLKRQQIRGKVVPLEPLDPIEIEETLRALQLTPGVRLLELGCGSGRYTTLLTGCDVVAVDVSRESLVDCGDALSAKHRVGLVQGDIATFSVVPRSFDRALSTLVSNLPTRELRMRMYQLAARALKPEGRFVFGTHYYGLRAKRDGNPQTGRYSDGGIFREYQTQDEVRAEALSSFARIRTRPMCVYPPLVARVGLPILPFARLLGRLPIARELGALLLGIADQPRAHE
jgi:SAM-dependent methyltransferase